jgi:cellulose biosynthesis protein BcsQ
MASEPGKVVAFYSFKGGTGRTMALANVGCALAQDSKVGRPVLLIDWDLEAPGLHRYFRKHVSNVFGGDDSLLNQAPGLIDLFIELRDQIGGSSNPQNFDAARSLLNQFPLSRYIIQTDVPRLHLLKAGRFDPNYAANVGSFQWTELYRRSPHLLRVFADQLAVEYSFVIIDSRTGLTDTSGICAMLMPEILITVFTPNLQNLSGVIDLVREAARYRAKSDDLRPLIVYPLPSRIEASEPDLRRRWRFGDISAGVPGFQPEFEEVFKDIYELAACDLSLYFDDVQVQHVPRYAYGEEIAVLVEETRDRLSLTQSYLRFTARLINGDVPWAHPAGPFEGKTVLLAAKEAGIENEWEMMRRQLQNDGVEVLTTHYENDAEYLDALRVGLERAIGSSGLASLAVLNLRLMRRRPEIFLFCNGAIRSSAGGKR